MVGRIKKEIKYKDEQNQIINKIIDILELNNNAFYLYDIENDKNKQHKLLDLINDINSYFSMNNMKSIKDIDKVKRPYMSIVKNILKTKYDILPTNKTIERNNNKIISVMYTLILRY